MPLSHKQRGQRSINFLFQNVKLLPEKKKDTVNLKNKQQTGENLKHNRGLMSGINYC